MNNFLLCGNDLLVVAFTKNGVFVADDGNSVNYQNIQLSDGENVYKLKVDNQVDMSTLKAFCKVNVQMRVDMRGTIHITGIEVIK